MRRTIPHTAVALTALALALAGCGGQADSGKGGDSDSVSSSPTPTTRPSTTPTGCAPASTLGVRDSGRTVCMAVGDTIRISLDGTAKRPWKPLSPKGSVLEAANSGIVLQPGDASAAYKAVEKGKTRLQSTRPLCAAQTGRVSCLGLQEWWVTVVVR
ncbi:MULTISPECIES: hypothetical protein [Streptomyces]|jgi:hypothetical protein|uniref:Lipoprotein n=1 Tax=Streptomyces spinosisporus TaxID=2927582 RepID=A0ABS9XQ59_9ACTN|nr:MULTISPECIES: hypothetical protein [Streptomyces]MCI3243057.1 hypothetical protein [Streptomyces spinosisporus]WUB36003.1 hypothetical protein OHN38_14175 [Streptomyces sp. NBC_00588]